MRLPLCFALLTLMVTSAQAQTADSGRLTDRGRLLLGGSIGGFWVHKQPPHSEAAKWALHVQPSGTYFVTDRLGLGMSLGVGVAERALVVYRDPVQVRDWELWAGPNLLWDLAITDRLSLFASPGVFYSRRFRRIETPEQEAETGMGDPTKSGARDFGRGEYDAHFVRFALSLPLTFHLSSSVAVGFGPTAWFDYFVSQHPRTTPALRIPDPFDPSASLPGEPYPRTRLTFGLASWVGGSF